MFVVHGLWSDGPGLCLWAEDTSAAAGTGGGAPGGRRRDPVRHPYAVGPEALGPALRAAPALVTADARELTLLLPTAGSRPLPSPTARVGAATRRSRAVPRLQPWRVPVLRLPARAALDVLGDRPGAGSGDNLAGEGDGPVVLPGADWAWLAGLAETALDLVARGRVLPGVVTTGDGPPMAVWRPAPGPSDTARVAELVGGMPPLCRAEVCGTDAGAWRTPAAEDVVTAALTSLVDAAVRAGLGGLRLAPPRRGRAPLNPPPGEALLAALVGDDPELRSGAGEVAKLGVVLAEWAASAHPAAGPLRTCFRLVPPTAEPEGDGPTVRSAAGRGAEPWRVEVLLQSTAEPSLLVPAADVWRAGPGLRSLRHAAERPQEQLLADLGRATRLWPGLEGALQVAQPDGLDLDPAGVVDFLATTVPLLEQAGFGVLVPPWWGTARARLGLRLRARPRTGAAIDPGPFGIGLAGVCDYDYEVAVGDVTLSAKELKALAKLKSPLVRVRGQWVELRPGDVDAALAALARPPAGTGRSMTSAEVLRIGLGLEAAPSGGALAVVGISATGWLGDLLAGEDHRLEPLPTPSGFNGVLRPYQERGLAWLWFLDQVGLGACLADDMGLGKTAQLLALLLAEREQATASVAAPARPAGGGGRGRRRRAAPRLAPTLLVCPMSLVGNWQREVARFAPGLTVHVHHGAAREAGASFTRVARRADLVVTTYALLARDRDLLAKVDWGRVVLDEAQNVKNPAAQASRAVRSLPAARRVALTGTPVENRLLELWSLMDFLNPGLLGSEGAFRRRFAVPVERYGDEEAAGTLKRMTGPFVLRRLKTDRSIIADLPDKVEMKVFCNLTREQATLYQAVVDDMLSRLEAAGRGIERMGIISGAMMKLKQVCNHPAHFLADGSRLAGSRSGKLARLDEITEEITAAGERALCFTQFAEMGTLLQSHCSARLGVAVPFLHGGVPKAARDDMVAGFQSPGGPPLLLLSLKAGGVGLNLTAANHVIHFDRWWNPAVEDQATDRAFRIGQRRDVQVRKFVCVGTLEERIDRMIEEKRALAERIVGTGEAWVTDLSLAQLRELVALSDDAVAED